MRFDDGSAVCDEPTEPSSVVVLFNQFRAPAAAAELRKPNLTAHPPFWIVGSPTAGRAFLTWTDLIDAWSREFPGVIYVRRAEFSHVDL